MKKIIILTVIVTAVFMIAKPETSKAPTKNECVAYWTKRVSSWNNAPTQTQIEEDNNFCGGIHE